MTDEEAIKEIMSRRNREWINYRGVYYLHEDEARKLKKAARHLARRFKEVVSA